MISHLFVLGFCLNGLHSFLEDGFDPNAINGFGSGGFNPNAYVTTRAPPSAQGSDTTPSNGFDPNSGQWGGQGFDPNAVQWGTSSPQGFDPNSGQWTFAPQNPNGGQPSNGGSGGMFNPNGWKWTTFSAENPTTVSQSFGGRQNPGTDFDYNWLGGNGQTKPPRTTIFSTFWPKYTRTTTGQRIPSDTILG